LITDGLFARTRNPNYLGELLIYLSFAGLALHWAPLVVVALFLAIVWIPNMRRKDRSLARYPEFADYKDRSYRLIPRVSRKRISAAGQT
jgi:protein-S-isoprenylcysteine O-methyltransferase Ste14